MSRKSNGEEEEKEQEQHGKRSKSRRKLKPRRVDDRGKAERARYGLSAQNY